jgi:hypothetical protein
LCLATISWSTENLRLPLDQVSPILTRGASIVLVDEIHAEYDHDNEENTANIEHVLTDGVGYNLNDVLGDNHGEAEPTTHSDITSMGKMMDEQQEMFNNAIQQNTRLFVKNPELLEANWEYCRESIPTGSNENQNHRYVPARMVLRRSKRA